MPLYEFVCENCGQFEQILDSFVAKEMVPCPSCGSPKAKRIFSSPTHSGVFSGIRHKAMRRAEKGPEPRVVRKRVGEPLAGTSPMPCGHDHSHGTGDPGYPPWMIKH